MIDWTEVIALPIFFEGFLYGLYSGIFTILLYLQCSSNNSKTPNAVFYALCLLYALSTATFVCDLLAFILKPMLNHIIFVQITINAFCDFTSQCIIIYRCWIVWGKDIRFVIIPSLLAITSLGAWLALNHEPPPSFVQIYSNTWFTFAMTALATSIAVNTLVTSLIVFRILEVFLEVKRVKPTSVERSLGSTRGTKLRDAMFVIIESNMALFAMQVVCVVQASIPLSAVQFVPAFEAANDFTSVINKMLTGIAPTIILARALMRLSFDDKESFKEAIESLRFDNPPSDPGTPQQTGSSSSMPLPGHWQDFERNEDNIPQVIQIYLDEWEVAVVSS